LEALLNYITLVIGALSGLIIVYGVVLGLLQLIRAELRNFRTKEDTSVIFEKIRYELGFHLLLGLEFLIAADVIRTILKPTLEELAILGGIVLVRTAISYFLDKEIRRQPIQKKPR
jgi:uncharacterized membrane protein